MFFDPSQEEDVAEFDTIPPGIYRVAVIDTAVKPTRKGDGKYMSVAFQVLAGEHKDRRVFTNFNLENSSEQAQKIGRSEYKRFLATIGITQPLKSENEAHKAMANKTLSIEITHRKGSDGKTWTDVKKFISKHDAEPKDQKMADADIPF